jgi:hypothetical protein
MKTITHFILLAVVLGNLSVRDRSIIQLLLDDSREQSAPTGTLLAFQLDFRRLL